VTNRTLGEDIRRLVDESVPGAPWLEDRVMAAVADAAGNKAAGHRHGRPLFSATTGLVAVLAALLVVVTLLGSMSARHTAAPSTQLTPNRDPAVVGYRLMLYEDMTPVYRALQKRGACNQQYFCTTALVQARSATDALLTDLANTPAPAQIQAYAADVKVAANEYVDQLTLAIDALQVERSDYLIVVYAPSVGDLDRAVAVVDCWPVQPVAVATIRGYACTAVSPGDRG
jgi:hypothetical protein